ncbi:hypothetical protein BN946_scf184588.g4, partial [Trametes cinnabarina]
TAIVFFRRFYVKNSYCETDPFIVAAACCYVAAKAEESPVHIKHVVSEARTLFGEYGIKSFPSDNSKLAEMEFYLVDELDLLGRRHRGGEAEDSPRYWGTGEGKLELSEQAIQTAWFIINDTLRSELCLLYPPHLLAVAAIYLTLVFSTTTRAQIQSASAHSSSSAAAAATAQHAHPDPSRRSSRSASSSSKKQPQPPDIIGWMAGLNVSMSLVATIAQEIISLYALWDRYSEDAAAADHAKGSLRHAHALRGSKAAKEVGSRGGSVDTADVGAQGEVRVTPMFLVQLLLRMREARMADLAHPASGRPVAVNKMLERTQAAG